MIRMNSRNSASEAKSYYFGTPSQMDYYSEDQQWIGMWGGRGAQELGLSGTVDKKQFEMLIDNINPQTGERLTPRTKEKRTIGYDINFHVPKSVSLLNVWAEDVRVAQAVRETVQEIMREIEKEAWTRVRLEGKEDVNRSTGNLVWTEFVHFTGRPVGGVPDPHLHIHILVFNATYDPVEERWKAAQFRMIKTQMPKYQAAFHNRLMQKIEALGYAVERRGKSFEVVGVPQSMNQKFSRRTAVVERAALEMGITDQEEKAKLGALTRESKRKDLNQKQLRAEWEKRLDETERRAMRELATIKNRILSQGARGEKVPPPTPTSTKMPAGTPAGIKATAATEPVEAIGAMERRAIDYALEHLFERASAVEEWRILESALRFGMGKVDLRQLKIALAERTELIRGTIRDQKMITTPAVLAEEREMARWVRQERGVCKPLALGYIIKEKKLTDEQRAANASV